MDGIFYAGDARSVHCGANLDEVASLTDDDLLGALDRAAERGEIVELYAHSPGKSVSLARLEMVVSRAHELGLQFVTYEQLADRATGPGIALSFDDHNIDAWTSIRPMLAGTHVTFFVSAFAQFTDEARALLHDLAADGHEIAAHTVKHLRAPPYVEQHGLHAYIADEVTPSIDALVADGYTVTSFAYPFGARTSELDEAILKHVRIVRTIEFPYRASVQSTCPY